MKNKIDEASVIEIRQAAEAGASYASLAKKSQHSREWINYVVIGALHPQYGGPIRISQQNKMLHLIKWDVKGYETKETFFYRIVYSNKEITGWHIGTTGKSIFVTPEQGWSEFIVEKEIKAPEYRITPYSLSEFYGYDPENFEFSLDVSKQRSVSARKSTMMPDDIRNIRKDFASGLRRKKMCESYGLHQSTLQDIIYAKSYKWVTNADGSIYAPPAFGTETKHFEKRRIRQLKRANSLEGLSRVQIAKEFGRSRSWVRDAVGENYRSKVSDPINDDTKAKIFDLRSTGMTFELIGKELNISQSTAWKYAHEQ